MHLFCVLSGLTKISSKSCFKVVLMNIFVFDIFRRSFNSFFSDKTNPILLKSDDNTVNVGRNHFFKFNLLMLSFILFSTGIFYMLVTFCLLLILWYNCFFYQLYMYFLFIGNLNWNDERRDRTIRLEPSDFNKLAGQFLGTKISRVEDRIQGKTYM